MLKLGALNAQRLYVGLSEVSRLYLGYQLIYEKSQRVVLDSGNFTLTGFDASILVPIVLDSGSFVFTGYDVAFRTELVVLESGNYALTGSPMTAYRTVAMQSGSFVLTGYDVPIAWSPSSLPTLNRWYDPSDSSTITLVSTVVSQINDKSGNAYHASQGTAANRPAIGSINGLDSLSFDGSNDRLESSLGVTPFSGVDKPFTFMGVIDLGADLSGARDFFSLWRSVSTTPVHVIRSFNGAWDSTRRDDSNVSVTVNPAVNHSGDPHIITVIFTGTTITIRVDGIIGVDNVSYNVGTITLDRITIGAFRTTFNFFLGNIGEMILCESALSDVEVMNAETYLSDKWGVALLSAFSDGFDTGFM